MPCQQFHEWNVQDRGPRQTLEFGGSKMQVGKDLIFQFACEVLSGEGNAGYAWMKSIDVFLLDRAFIYLFFLACFWH